MSSLIRRAVQSEEERHESDCLGVQGRLKAGLPRETAAGAHAPIEGVRNLGETTAPPLHRHTAGDRDALTEEIHRCRCFAIPIPHLEARRATTAVLIVPSTNGESRQRSIR